MIIRGLFFVCLSAVVFSAGEAVAFEGETLIRPVLTKNEKAPSFRKEKIEDSWRHDVAGVVSDFTNDMVSSSGESPIDIYAAETAEELNAMEPASGGIDPLPIQYDRIAGFGTDAGPIRMALGYSVDSDDPGTFDDGEGVVVGAGFTDGDWQYGTNLIVGANDKVGYDRGRATKLGLSARYRKDDDQMLSFAVQASDFASSGDDDVRMTIGFTKKLDFRPKHQR